MLGPSVDPDRLNSLNIKHVETVEIYWDHGSPKEIEQMLRYILQRYGGNKSIQVSPPSPVLEEGLVAFKNGSYCTCQPKIVHHLSHRLNEVHKLSLRNHFKIHIFRGKLRSVFQLPEFEPTFNFFQTD